MKLFGENLWGYEILDDFSKISSGWVPGVKNDQPLSSPSISEYFNASMFNVFRTYSEDFCFLV